MYQSRNWDRTNISLPGLKELTTKNLNNYSTPNRSITKFDATIPLNAISPAKKEVTNKIMEESYKQCDNMMKKNHQMKLEALKQLADSMDKEREYVWKKRAQSANKMRTYVKSLEMKNGHKADTRIERALEKSRIKNTENTELTNLLAKQRDKHKKEEDEIEDLHRQQDYKHMQEKDDLESTKRKQSQKHRHELEELELTRKRLLNKHMLENEEIHDLQIKLAEKSAKEKSDIDLE